MADSGSPRRWLDRTVRIWVDTLTYAFVVTTLSVFGSLVVSVATGGWLARANAVLFVAGWVQLAYATVVMWPSSPDDLRDPPDENTVGTSTRIQSIARALPPLRWMRLPLPAERMPPEAQLFVAAILVLAVSFSAEAFFGVG